VPWTKPGHGGGDVRHLDAIERQQFGTGRRVGMFRQDIVIHGCRSVSTHLVPGLPARDSDHPRAHSGVSTETRRIAPDRDHRVLQDLLAHPSIADDEENLAEKYATVTPIEIS